MNTLQRIIIGIVGIALVGVFGFTLTSHTVKSFGDVANYPLPSKLTDSTVVCGPSSSLLLATSTAGRPLVYLANTATSTMQVFVSTGNTAVINQGIMIPANTTLLLNQSAVSLYAMYCIASASTTVSYSTVN